MKIGSMRKAVISGIMGTVAMTTFTTVANFVHLPKADYQAFFATQFGASMGWFAFLFAGILLAHFYGNLFHKKLPSRSWKKGALYGLGIWAVVQVILLPLLGHGTFPGTAMGAFGALLTLAAYGATVGYLHEH